MNKMTIRSLLFLFINHRSSHTHTSPSTLLCTRLTQTFLLTYDDAIRKYIFLLTDTESIDRPNVNMLRIANVSKFIQILCRVLHYYFHHLKFKISVNS